MKLLLLFRQLKYLQIIELLALMLNLLDNLLDQVSIELRTVQLMYFILKT